MRMLKFFGKTSLKKTALFILLASIASWQLPAMAEQSADADEVTATVVVNINTAGVQELADTLNGVGEKRAQAIVAYREANGPFTSVDQLQEVKGIGEKVLAKNRHLIVLE